MKRLPLLLPLLALALALLAVVAYDTLSMDGFRGLLFAWDDSTVYADEIKLSQVIYNFLSNALKYSDDDTKITIRIRDDEEKVRLEVSDQGNGISEEALPYIWDRYYKVDKNFNRSVNSTGLGLAIAKAILEAHKARYGVESQLGKGSTFWFELSKDYDEES